MQIIVLGMHRSGTSSVACLLNMMGAYFAPEGVSMSGTEENLKGYYERYDVWKINERVLCSLSSTWHNISEFEIEQLSDETREQFITEASLVVADLDAHRPWILKDPRINLLLPLWESLLEVPIYIYVYRKPVQIAQSLQNRNGFPLQLGLALWEKYTVRALQHCQKHPIVLVSYHDLLETPQETVKILFDSLIAAGVQGLHLPSDKEIEAFINRDLQHQRGNQRLQNAHINRQQFNLDRALENKTILELDKLPTVSAGAEEQLKLHTQDLALNQTVTTQQSQLDELSQNLASIASTLSQTQAERDALATEKQQLEKHLQQAEKNLQQTQIKAQQQNTQQQQNIIKVQQDSKQKTQCIHTLNEFIDKLEHDFDAASNSITWCAGNILANSVRKLTLQGSQLQDHFQVLKKGLHQFMKQGLAKISAKTQPMKSATTSYTPSTHNTALTRVSQQTTRSNHTQRLKQWHKKPQTIDIIICVYNALEDVKACIESVLKNTVLDFRLIIINDASDQPTTDYLNQIKVDNIQILHNSKNLGYTQSANIGFKAATSDYILILNSDCIVTLGWLHRLLDALESEPQTGIVSPLSNAASYQSMPQIFQANSTEWHLNPLAMPLERWAELVAETSPQRHPTLPNLNGFCLLFRREVFEKVGYFDEQLYPFGYGEENDLCLRTQDAGFKTRIADDCYVFHAKSKSFSHERRKKLAAEGHKRYTERFGRERLQQNTWFMQNINPMDAQRWRLQRLLADSPLRIAFILPVTAISGGVISVFQVVMHLNVLGKNTSVIIPAALRDEALDIFNITAEHVLGFHVVADIPTLAKDFDIVIATHNSSVAYTQSTLAATTKPILPAYFVQDYEPWFYGKGSDRYQNALDSYSLIPDNVAFAKTDYLCDTVQIHHPDVNMHKIRPGFDISIYQPNNTALTVHQPTRICAMVRPVSPRRAPQQTLDILNTVAERTQNGLEIHVFGCTAEELNKLRVPANVVQHGVLTQEALFKCLQECDIFLDLSPYQAFGRTGLEAMAAGCLAILPDNCGTSEYADAGNAVLLDMNNHKEVTNRLIELVNNPKLRQSLKRQALDTALTYNCMGDAMGQWELLSSQHQLRFAPPKVSLIMLVRNHKDMTQRCIDTLKANTQYSNYELIIVDNASDADTHAMLQTTADNTANIHLITNPENHSFAKANNQAADMAEGELLVLINNDLEFQDELWLNILVTQLLNHPLAAAAGPCLTFADGKIQSASVEIKIDPNSGDFLGAAEHRQRGANRAVSAVTGACMLIWKNIYQSKGGLDDRYWYGQEDVDFCLNLRASGYEIHYCDDSTVIHHESKTRSFNETTLKNREAIKQKWAGVSLNALL